MTLDEVKVALDEVRPYLQNDGGDIEIVALLPDNTLKVRLLGACDGCPHAKMTIKNGVESFLKERLPQLKSVEV
jgi:Fe-S cluster biogenesis protein NfuA